MANSTDLERGEVDAIGETVQFLLAYEEKRHDVVHQPCIFKVPSVLKDISPNSYDPKVVSIGPLHKEAKNVQEMEARKPSYLHNLLADLDLPREQTLQRCVEKVNASIDRIKESYDDIKSYTDVELAQMMVVDGFFILEFLYNYELDLLQTHIFHDLLLLENQIPFFVLQDIFECTILKCEQDLSLTELILHHLKYFHLFVQELREEKDPQGTTPDHILGLLHKCCQPKESIQPNDKNSTIHSIADLVRAGVSFKPNKDPSWPMAIEYKPSRIGCFSWSLGKPTVKMPEMRFHDSTESFIRNLAVYEISSSDVPNYITSYISVLDNIVDTTEDIAILMESGILTNIIGSNEEAANMINNVFKGFPIHYPFHNTQLQQLDKYYNGYWPKTLAHLRRKYFSSPWSIIALIAAIVLFALTIVQTIFAINPV